MHFEIYQDLANKWQWRLCGQQGQRLAESHRGLETQQECLAQIRIVQGSGLAPIRELKTGTEDANGQQPA